MNLCPLLARSVTAGTLRHSSSCTVPDVPRGFEAYCVTLTRLLSGHVAFITSDRAGYEDQRFRPRCDIPSGEPGSDDAAVAQLPVHLWAMK